LTEERGEVGHFSLMKQFKKRKCTTVGGGVEKGSLVGEKRKWGAIKTR